MFKRNKTDEELLKRTASHYDKHNFDYEDEFRKEMVLNKLPISEVIKKLKKTDKVLEMGCGVGVQTKYIKDYSGCDLTGVDISTTCLEIAKKKGLNVKYGNALNLDFKDNTFDVCICCGIAHHTSNPYKVFQEAIRVTKKGGTIFLGVYNKHNFYYPVYNIFHWPCVGLRKIFGEKFLKILINPFFYLIWVRLGSFILAKKEKVNFKPMNYSQSWNYFNDQIMTPIAAFYSKKEIREGCNKNNVMIIKEDTYALGQMITFILKKE